MTTEERNDYFFDVVNPRLDELARRICEATGMDDQVLGQVRCQELAGFYEEETRRGYWHPSLTETMADFTAVYDAPAALPYYRLALEQARELNLDSYSILFAMAEALAESGLKEQAEACLRDGRNQAQVAGDVDYIKKADSLAREFLSS